MTWDETSTVLEYLLMLNPAMKVIPGMADAWHDQLQEYTYDEVRAAARLVGGRQTWVSVAEIRAACKLARLDRLRAAGDLYALVQADPDDHRAYHAEFQRLRAQVASGRRTRAQLEAGSRD